MQTMKDFYKYFVKFYGPKGLYPNKKGKLKLSDINKAVAVYLSKKPNHEFYGDSVDRESIRDILIKQKKLVPAYNKNEGMIKLKDLITEASKHGFDLTDFKRNGFKQLLKALKIKPKAQLDRNGSGWEWKGNGILIVTGNNPITGEYAGGAVKRKNEKDYASYIGIEGKPELVKQAVELVHKWASYIKNESPGRRNYI